MLNDFLEKVYKYRNKDFMSMRISEQALVHDATLKLVAKLSSMTVDGEIKV
jgi:hypothetical protein